MADGGYLTGTGICLQNTLDCTRVDPSERCYIGDGGISSMTHVDEDRAEVIGERLCARHGRKKQGLLAISAYLALAQQSDCKHSHERED